MSFSGSCKGDIFLNPALKEGRDILREHYHDNHVIHAVKYFASYEGYDEVYCDFNAGFGAIATEVAGYFKHNILHEPDEILAQVLNVNMTLKGIPGQWEISPVPPRLTGKGIVRCAMGTDANILLETGASIVIFQNKQPVKVSAPLHDAFLYSADMDKSRPFKTLWTLITKGYAFKMRKITLTDELAAGDYIFLPKDFDQIL
ncbi:MAG: hypothetical protein JKY59_09020 [Emcibacter sp.]|nr:hypothetical protein [Emcibacter sp.]